jgi:hypothetical protein
MRRLVILLALAVLAACSSDGEESSTSTTLDSDESTTTTAEPSTTVEEEEPEAGAGGYESIVEALAADEMEGRDNQTPGSELAQDFLIAQLEEFSDPAVDGFRQPFAEGTNIIGLIPGTDLADEYVILGAHYDHLGRDCPTSTPGDDVCNGAADNAAGVAAVLEIGRGLAEGDGPLRSVILAFWDAEEDGLLGAGAYIADPVVPLEDTIVYLNWDILGVNLLPSLADVTVMVGAETGGPSLVDAATEATGASELDTLALSLLFGQGRSDHAVFAAAGVPVVFFTDANSGCYHTSQDDMSTLDLDKLGQQIATGDALARNLVDTDTPPAYKSGTPVATYEDAVSMLVVVSQAEPDFRRFPAAGRAFADQFLGDLEAMVEMGPEAFDDDALGTLLGGSAEVVSLLAASDCDAFHD